MWAPACPALDRTELIPKIFFFLFSAGTVFLLPFVNIFYRQHCGFDERLIGVLCALKPWVAASAGSLVVSMADSSRRHLAVLLAAYLVAYLGRSAMALSAAFSAQLALALLTEAAASPLGALVDAAVVASAADDGGYGRTRMFASVGWGLTAPLAGWVVASHGLRAAFMCFTILVGLCLLPACLLPMEALAASPGRQGGEAGSQGPAAGQGSPGGRGGPSQKLNGGSAGGGEPRGGGEGLAAAGKAAPSAGHSSSWSIGAGPGNAGRAIGCLQDPTPAPAAGPAVFHLAACCGASCEQAPPPPAVLTPLGGSPSQGRPPPSPGHLPPVPAPPAPVALHCDWRGSGCGDRLEVVTEQGWHPLEEKQGCHLSEQKQGLADAGAGGRRGGGVWDGLLSLLRDPQVLVFFFLALLMGVGNGAIGFLFLYLDELKAPGTLLGLCLSVNCAAEVPVFYWSGPLLRALGVSRALHVAMAAYVARLLAYLALPLLPTPWLLLPAELLQGATFALAWSAGTVHVKRISPPHLRSTVQSVFQGCYTGVGAGLGGLAGGMLYGTYGAAALFRTAALALAAGWLAALAVLRACPPAAATTGQGQFQAAAERFAWDCESDGAGEEVALLRAA